MIGRTRGRGYGMREKPPLGEIGDLLSRATVHNRTACTCDGKMRNGGREGTKGNGAMLLARNNFHLSAKFQVCVGLMLEKSFEIQSLKISKFLL